MVKIKTVSAFLCSGLLFCLPGDNMGELQRLFQAAPKEELRRDSRFYPDIGFESKQFSWNLNELFNQESIGK